MCSNTSVAVEQLAEALAVLAAAPREAAGARDRIGRLLVARAQLDAILHADVASVDSARTYEDDGAASTASWLRASHRVARRDASALVHQSRELRALSLTSAALAAGSISREHVVPIVKAKVASGLDAMQFARYESVLVELAVAASPDEVRTAAARLVEAEAPDRDKQLVDALAGRRFDMRPVGDLVRIDAMVDKPSAEALAVGVEALSRRLPGDERSWHERRADAFGELVTLGVESGRLPQQGRVKPHLNVTVTLDQLTGIAGSGALLRRFGKVPSATARRLGCDAVLTRVLTDASGEVVDVGRSSRHTTTAQNKAIAARYDACAYPNCTTTLNRCDIHHVRWWSHGGGTDLSNLIPLCKQHHMFVHEHGYSIESRTLTDGRLRTGPPRWTFLSPRGRPIPDHRHALRLHLEQLTLATATATATLGDGSREPAWSW